jgi:hypothetical protein
VKSTSRLEEVLVDIFRQFGLVCHKEKFLTVCGKCGGEIEEVFDLTEETRLAGKILPNDRQIFACKQCGQVRPKFTSFNSSVANEIYCTFPALLVERTREQLSSEGNEKGRRVV